jgi:hypothetical protein
MDMAKKLVFLALVLVAGFWTGTAFGGAVNLPQAGQFSCYDSSYTAIFCDGTGQDGEILSGEPWPDPRFTVTGDCVTDNLTGLMWAKNGNLPNGTRTWPGALDFAQGLSLCGYSDWRLPNVNELESLVHSGQSNSATWLNAQGFTNVQSGSYWSSSAFSGAPYTSFVWIVGMHGWVDGNYNGNNTTYVWPVRGGQ